MTECKWKYGYGCRREATKNGFCRYHQPRKEVPEAERCKGHGPYSPYPGRSGTPCEYRAQKGTEYCKIHTPGYHSPRSIRAMKEGMANARKRIDKENADKAAWNALREIAAGHNDPRTLAQETLKLLEE